MTGSDASGVFAFSNVAAGEYLLSATAPGLSLIKSSRLLLQAGESKSENLSLTVLATRSEVNVTAAGVPQSVDETAKALEPCLPP